MKSKRTRRTLLPGMWLGALSLAGCTFPAPDTPFYRATYQDHLPAMVDAHDKLVAVGCEMIRVSFNPFTVVGRCDVALSTAASDLANDLQNRADFVKMVTNGASDQIREALIVDTSARCKLGIGKAFERLSTLQIGRAHV